MNRAFLTSFTILCLLHTMPLMGFAFNVQLVRADHKTWTIDDDGPADFHTIQEAISAASDGDTVFVYNGTYYENVVVNKSLLVIGEDRRSTIIDGNNNPYNATVTTTASNISFTNFTVRNGGKYGISVSEGTSYNNITHNLITDNDLGIYIKSSSRVTLSENDISDNYGGVFFVSSSENTISRNNIMANGEGGGLKMHGSSDTVIFRNNVTGRSDYYHDLGLTIHSSSNLTLRNNIIANNRRNFEVTYGSVLSHFIHDIDVSNTVDGKPIFYLINQNNVTINPSTHPDIGYLALVNSTDVTVEELKLENSAQSVLAAYTTGSQVISNTIPGIDLYSSSFSNVSLNNMTTNGVYIQDSSFTTVSVNNMYDCSVELYDSSFITVSANEIIGSIWGIHLDNASHNSITRNTVAMEPGYWDVGDGIYIFSSSDNDITANNVTGYACMQRGYYGHGIWLWASLNNTLRNNKMVNNTYNFGLTGAFVNDIDTSNTVDGKPIYFWTHQANRTVPQDAGFVTLVNCTQITVQNLTLTKNREGIILVDTTNSTIYHNNFIDNYVQVAGYRSLMNTWDNGYPSGGNYWSDYDGSDMYSGPHQNETGYDWIGDSPYIEDENNQDNYPLMDLFVPEKEEMRIAYRNLLLKHGELLSDFETLNSSSHELLDDITDLQGEYSDTVNNLQEQIEDLQESIDNIIITFDSTLQTSADELQGQIDSLNSTLTLEQQAIVNELGTIRNLMYVFIATTIVLMTAIVYFAIRKPKIKP